MRRSVAPLEAAIGEGLRGRDTVLPSARVCSVDEVLCRLDRRDVSVPLMPAVKAAIASVFGRTLTVSLGVASTPLLAKMAAESDKPDGTVHWSRLDLPLALLGVPPSAVPGLGPARAARLAVAGLGGVGTLWAAHSRRWGQPLGTVEGERIGYAFHGADVPTSREPRRSMSCSRVLVPGECEPAFVYALARGWPAGGPDVVSAYSVQAVALLDVRPSVPELGFCDGPDPEGVISALLDPVQERFGAAGLDLGRILRHQWMGRKIAFPVVPS